MNKEIYYAGIGSRSTPKEVLEAFVSIAKWCGENNFILRSGGANGADSSFEYGCDLVNGKKEIYLPWNGFNDHYTGIVLDEYNTKPFEIAKQFHPYWNNLKQGGRKLMARNSYQVLGKDLNTPSNFIVCYTENGSAKGGTGQAIRIAKYYNIPVFDAGSYNNIKDFKKVLSKYIKEELLW